MSRVFAVVPPAKALYVWLGALLLVLPLVLFAFQPLLSDSTGSGAVLVGSLLPVLALGTLTLFGLRRHVVALEGGQLVVKAWLYTQRIPVTDLDPSQARIVDLDACADTPWHPGIRLNGLEFPRLARFGHFRGKRLRQKVFCLITARQRVLMLPQRSGRVLLLSLERPQALLDALSG